MRPLIHSIMVQSISYIRLSSADLEAAMVDRAVGGNRRPIFQQPPMRPMQPYVPPEQSGLVSGGIAQPPESLALLSVPDGRAVAHMEPLGHQQTRAQPGHTTPAEIAQGAAYRGDALDQAPIGLHASSPPSAQHQQECLSGVPLQRAVKQLIVECWRDARSQLATSSLKQVFQLLAIDWDPAEKGCLGQVEGATIFWNRLLVLLEVRRHDAENCLSSHKLCV